MSDIRRPRRRAECEWPRDRGAPRLGDATHAAFDNVTFGDGDTILVSEDRGNTLHEQLNVLDSAWAYPLSGGTPLRVIAQGRDVNATPTAEEDNEVTGIFVSDGDAQASHQYGTPKDLGAARAFFFTQQHGDDTVYELTHD